MSCLSPPPLDRDKPPNPILVLLVAVFVLLLFWSAASGAARAHPDPPDPTRHAAMLGYWGICGPGGKCYSALLRFRIGDRLEADCAVSMWSVGTILRGMFPPQFEIKIECLDVGAPEPAWWRAIRKDEILL